MAEYLRIIRKCKHNVRVELPDHSTILVPVEELNLWDCVGEVQLDLPFMVSAPAPAQEDTEDNMEAKENNSCLEIDSASVTPTSETEPPKRKRGRPKKVVVPESDTDKKEDMVENKVVEGHPVKDEKIETPTVEDSIDKEESAPVVSTSETETPKRKRGRPKKVVVPESDTDRKEDKVENKDVEDHLVNNVKLEVPNIEDKKEIPDLVEEEDSNEGLGGTEPPKRKRGRPKKTVVHESDFDKKEDIVENKGVEDHPVEDEKIEDVQSRKIIVSVRNNESKEESIPVTPTSETEPPKRKRGRPKKVVVETSKEEEDAYFKAPFEDVESEKDAPEDKLIFEDNDISGDILSDNAEPISEEEDKIIRENIEAENKKDREESASVTSTSETEPPKRKRGRPKKVDAFVSTLDSIEKKSSRKKDVEDHPVKDEKIEIPAVEDSIAKEESAPVTPTSETEPPKRKRGRPKKETQSYDKVAFRKNTNGLGVDHPYETLNMDVESVSYDNETDAPF